MSAASCDGLGDVFRAMFGYPAAKDFSLGRTKLGYIITEALYPYFRKRLLEDIGSSFFTLLYDETTNAEGVKELNVMIRYWSELTEQVSCCHLETFFVGRATAEDLLAHLQQSLANADLPSANLLMLGSNSSNVNKKVW